MILLDWGPAIRITDIEVNSLIRTFKVRIVNQYDGESCKGGPGNGTSTDTGTPVCYKMLQVLTL
jgi:hypothetical protein